MKNNKLSWFSLCLAALLLSAAATACGSSAEEGTKPAETVPTTETAAAAETEQLYKADYLPETDYGGYVYRIYDYAETAQYVPEETGNIIDDAVYKRNRIIEERYNIKMQATTFLFTDYVDVASIVKKSGSAGSDDFDLATLIFRDAYNFVLDGIVPAGSTLPVADMTQPWHEKSVNDSITINGVTLLDFTAFDKRPGGSTILFNKKIANDLDMESPYALVDAGTWTTDVMLKMATDSISDLNGNGTFERGDRFGLISEWDALTCITYLGTGHMLVNIVDGIPTVSTDQILLDSFAKMVEYVKQKGAFLDTFKEFGQAESSRIEGHNLFKQGQCMFVHTGTNNLVNMGDMVDDYGILPYPKWTEDQERYYNMAQVDNISVPLSCSSDLARVCTIKEALAVESMNYVNPAYYDNALKNRYVRDEESIRMIELVTATAVVDLGQNPWWDIVRTPWLDSLEHKKDNFASAVEKNMKKSNKAIEKMLECIEAIKGNA